jgi:hypothetical protein
MNPPKGDKHSRPIPDASLIPRFHPQLSNLRAEAARLMRTQEGIAEKPEGLWQTMSNGREPLDPGRN